MTPTRAALEAALAADPDDPVRHAAYADLLLEEGDPRGEFVRLQLALEDPDLPADRRAAMRQAADELLKRHEAEWLGPMAPVAAVGRLTWQRGWAYAAVVPGLIRLNPEMYDYPFGLISVCPTARLLKVLVVSKPGIQDDGSVALRTPEPEPPRSDPPGGEYARIESYEVVSRTVAYTYFEPPFGESLVNALIDSGLLSRLHDLDLSRCDITDDGAAALAACPDVPRLKSLTLDGNLISPIGVAALAEVGVRVGPQFWDRGRGDAYV